MTTLTYLDVELKEKMLDKPQDVATQHLLTFLERHKALVEKGITLRFSLGFAHGRKRSSTTSNVLSLDILLSASEAVKIWEKENEHGKYTFNFGSRTFMYNEKPVYLSPQEQLVLYQLLVLKHTAVDVCWAQILFRLRKRFGETFLKGFL